MNDLGMLTHFYTQKETPYSLLVLTAPSCHCSLLPLVHMRKDIVDAPCRVSSYPSTEQSQERAVQTQYRDRYEEKLSLLLYAGNKKK